MLNDYAIKLRDDGRRRDYCQRQLLALTRLWAYAPHLLPSDRSAIKINKPGYAVGSTKHTQQALDKRFRTAGSAC
jgi:hypothetical protein